jgi:hypothetical protein
MEKGGPRAERARRLLPYCTEPVEAFRLLANQPPKVCAELLRLTRPEVLIPIYEAMMKVCRKVR